MRAIAALAVVLGLAGCSTSTPPPAERRTPASSASLAVAGAENRGAAIAADGARVVVAWAATTGDVTNIHAATSVDGGITFGAPVRVNTVDGDARFTGEQAPRVAVGRDIVVAWQSRIDGKSAIRLARSIDRGRSFQPAMTAHETGLAGTRGWASLGVDSTGVAHVTWLDTRPASPPPLPAAPMPPGHVHGAHQSMRQNVFHASIAPDGSRRETLIAPDVCFCCKTAVATGPDGAIYAAWRHIYEPNFRDMAVARSDDGGRTFQAPVRVSEDGWAIDGCPEDGPSLGVDANGVVHITWPTLTPGSSELRKSIFYSYSTDGGRTFAPRMQVDGNDPTRRPGHPQLALGNGRVIVTWDEGQGDDRRILARAFRSTTLNRWTPDAGEFVTIGDDRMATYPAIVSTLSGVMLAWTAGAPGTAIRVTKLRSALP